MKTKLTKSELLIELKDWATSFRNKAICYNNTEREPNGYIDPKKIAQIYDRDADILEQTAEMLEKLVD